MTRTRGRRAVGGVVLGAAAIAGVLGTTGSASAQRSGAGGPLRDGAWAGLLAVGVTLDFSTGEVDLVAMGDGSGTFNLILTGGNAGGDFQLGGSSQAALDADTSTGYANAVAAITGTMTGTATGPVVAPQQGHFDIVGSVIVDGFEAPFSVSTDMGPGELSSSTLTITSSSCTVASGTWAEEFAAAAASAGATVSGFQGSWTATFLGNEPGTAEAALAELLGRGEAVIGTWLASGTFDSAAMEQVLVDAEHFAIAGPTNDTCSHDHRSSWASPLAGMVERLLTAMAHSSSTTAEALRFGVAAGLRTGVLPSIDGPVESDLLTKGTELLAAEVAAGDTTGITLIAVAADAMGWTELSAAAAEALGG